MMSKTLNDDFDRMIKYEIESVMSLLNKINKMAVDGLFTEEQARDYAAEILRNMSYGEELTSLAESLQDQVAWFDVA